MKLIAYGDIMSGGTSVFISTTRVDGGKLCVSFSGAIRIDNPHLHLQTYIDELDAQLAKLNVRETELDFTELRFCNSNGFYVIMDIAELVYRSTKGPVGVLRLSSDFSVWSSRVTVSTPVIS